MNKTERFNHILDYFRQQPRPTTELEFQTTYQLLVAVVLSAQCTDKRVNMVTPALFHDYPTVQAMANADEAEIFEYIKSISYPNAKAHHLIEAARIIVNEYDGEIPSDMDLLLRLTDNNPYKVELELKKHIPEEDIPDAHHWLLLHGRYICTSLKPKCDKCPFDDICPKLLENSKLR